MKFSPEFQPWRFLGLGFPVIFLLFFCTFCARGDPSSYEDWFDSDEYTTRRSGTWSTPTRTTSRKTGAGTGTRTGKTFPDFHVIGTGSEYNSDRKIECRGADVSNLSVMQCDGTFLECRSKLSCFVNRTSCTNHDEISSGENCVTRQSSGYYFSYYRSHPLSVYDRSGSGTGTGTGTEKCLKVPSLWSIQAGIVKCVSSLPSSSSSSSTASWLKPFQPNPNPNTTRTTIDYFYYGVNSKFHLLSSLVPPNKTMIRLGIMHSGKELHLWREEKPEIVYPDEQVVVTCTAENFLIDPKSIKIKYVTQNGTEHQIDAALYSKSSGWHSLSEIRGFRVPKDVKSVNCVGRRLDTLEIVETTTKIIVIDPPPQLLVKAPNGSEFQVDSPSKIGCNLSPLYTIPELRALRRKLFNLLDISQHSEFWITSPVSFLRFQNITKGNFSCTKLQLDGNLNSKSNSNSNDRFDYYFDLEVKKPRIEKPAGGVSVVNLNGDYDRPLVCKYTGNPMPYVIWLKNGKEIFYTVGKEISAEQRNIEKSVLHLPIENLENSTEIYSDSTYSNLKYSCVVQNHLGMDRLDFVIENEKNSASESQSKSKDEEKSSGLAFGLIISCLFLLIIIGLVFNIIRGKQERKRAVVTKSRGDENGTSFENVGVILDVNSGNLNNPNQNHSQSNTELSNNEVSLGISTPRQFHSGDAKYKMLS